jgi:tetratricopeptide (TPR) repeat protein
VLAGLAAVVSGCPSVVRQPTTVERIGGAERVRRFASPTAYEAFLRAELALARGEAGAAARQLELAELADPADGYLAARRAEVLSIAGEREAALAAARQGTERFPREAATWLVLGEILAAQGDAAAASEAFTRALAEAPSDPEVRGAIARAQGASAASVAHAIETAPEARVGDRTLAQRLALEGAAEERPVLRTMRRERARRAWERRAWREVDVILSPLVLADPTAVIDRVRVIEARARDGRPGDAARLVPGVPLGTGAHGVPLAERARLWLIAGRAELAAEEAAQAFAQAPDDVQARRVLGEARVRTGRIEEGVMLLAGVPVDSPHFAEARIAAAEGLSRAGRHALADAALVRAVAMVPGDDAVARDRLRIARARLQMRRGGAEAARTILAEIESPLGRQQRGALLAHETPPAPVLADLRVRSGDRGEDAEADAWIALVCFQHPQACPGDERERALRVAREQASGAPATMRAMALASGEPATAMELVRQAALRDPLSPWNDLLVRLLGARNPEPAGVRTGAPTAERRDGRRGVN